MRPLFFTAFSVIFGLAVIYSNAAAEPGSSTAALDRIVAKKNSSEVGISVVDAATGESIYSRNGDALLKPASVMKLIMTGAVFDALSPDDTFRTHFLTEGRSGDTARKLYIKGEGDPNFTIENAWLAARRLRLSGIRKIGSLVLDESSFVGTKGRSGQRAYATGASALSFNFNSFAFNVCPTKPGEPAQVAVDPFEVHVHVTGAITTTGKGAGSFSIDEAGESGGAPSYRVSGTIGSGRSCEIFYRSVSDPVAYFGATFLKLLDEVGIDAPKTFERGAAPSGADELFVHSSKSLSLIVRDMNQFSNNFIAEQLLFRLGDTGDGRFDREKGLERIKTYLRKIGANQDGAVIVDGSGLSHDNRVRASIFTRVIQDIEKHWNYLAEFEGSLSVSASSGTLKKRDFGLQSQVVRGKTGTLDGVSSLAGIVQNKKGRKLAFAILENKTGSKDAAVDFENEFVHELAASNL